MTEERPAQPIESTETVDAVDVVVIAGPELSDEQRRLVQEAIEARGRVRPVEESEL